MRLHERFGGLVPVWLAGIATLVDVARSSHGWPWIEWLNMLVVWGLAHQLAIAAPFLITWPMLLLYARLTSRHDARRAEISRAPTPVR